MIKSYQKKYVIICVLTFVVGFVLFIATTNQSPSNNNLLAGKNAVVYRSVTCGCCANFIKYLRKAGVQVEEKLTENMATIKQQFGVPDNLKSCHTTRIENYTVEGHIPSEVIQKLLTEKPDIDGIALPGMPSGSPGMPGGKIGTFDISSFNADGTSLPYLSF
ncbi:hypothetical protein HYV57_05685 [Candidatus Peregrinibacteria bacterium]|nr:hypothetical protein [Candidatus Peregrinibacteria bacterium]